MKKNMTHEEHLALAKLLINVSKALMLAHITAANKLGKTARATELLKRAVNAYNDAKCELDTLYHAATSNEQFMEHGHIYYGSIKKED